MVSTPLVQESDYIAQESNSFLKRFFNGNITSMVSSYLDSHHLSSNEIETLRSLLEEKEGSAHD